jgi:hypothetical protein
MACLLVAGTPIINAKKEKTMKRIWLFLVIAAMALTMCACGGIDAQTQQKLDRYEKYAHYIDLIEKGEYEKLYQELLEKEPTGDNQTGQEPADDEKRQLQQYRIIASALQEYAKGNEIWVTQLGENGNDAQQHSGQAALRFCYETLQTLTAVDQWADSDYVKNELDKKGEILWDRQALLANFTCIGNKLISMTGYAEDHMGNVSDNEMIGEWHYDAQGRVLRSRKPWTDSQLGQVYTDGAYMIFELDEQGRPSRAECHDYWFGNIEDEILGRREYAYNADGTQMTVTIKTNQNHLVVDYFYDAQGLLLKSAYKESENYRTETVYTYDSGRLMQTVETIYRKLYSGQEVIHQRKTLSYTYDANGTPASALLDVYMEYEDATYQDRIEFTCDEQGRVVQEKIIYGDRPNGIAAAEKVYAVYTYHYNDFYIYTPAQ